MLKRYRVPVYKQNPFLRLLLPLIMGIVLEWYLQFSLQLICAASASFLLLLATFALLPLAIRYKFKAQQGLTINLLLIGLGLLITWQKDIRHNKNWYGNYYKDSSYLIVRIDEPLIEKARSYKANGYVEAILQDGKKTPCKGKLLLYFSKDSTVPQLHYGDKILINKNLQAIKNSGNPGAFNYERYAAFQQLFHNVFLKDKDWVALNDNDGNAFNGFIFSARDKVLAVLQKYISDGKDELGIAEALLIGYTNDLDKDLVQSYSNTGVVHIIAISGMHLALIYVMLVWVFSRLPLIKRSTLAQVILILSCLWLFSLLTGGSASVIRSAVMFTFISIGKNFFRKAPIYNSLAASAFVMLLYNPYYLWDVGFQLSYLAVVGIIIFQKPIYHLLVIKNKKIDLVWQMAAVTLSAQVLTFPVCIYYFHQFPTLFLLTNLVVVPLSTIILYAEIFLVALAWIPYVGTYAGKITGWLVWLMNRFILWIDSLSFAVWDRIYANVLSTWVLYALVIAAGIWLMNKNKKAFKFAMVCLLAFTMVQTYGRWQIAKQHKLIVYNVAQHRAIDIIKGNAYRFIGDSIMLVDGVLQNFHLKPGRIAMQLTKRTDSIPELYKYGNFFQIGNKKVLFIDSAVVFEVPPQKIDIDLIIISKNPKLYIPQLASVFNCGQYIFDASNSLWKIGKWQRDCEKLNLPFYSLPEKGAFIVDL